MPSSELLSLANSQPFLAKGACRTVDPDVMFPHEKDLAGQNAAKKVCLSCDVMYQCRAANMNEPAGVWGGLTEDERLNGLRRDRRRRRKEAAAGQDGLPLQLTG
jgi:WhiB family redox-sensing transcriptional regulator